MEDAFSADSDAAARVVGTEPDLKPIHIAVMIITLLHAVAIAVWAVVFLSSTKSTFPSPCVNPDQLTCYQYNTCFFPTSIFTNICLSLDVNESCAVDPASVDRQSPKGPAADPRNIETKKDK